MGHGVRVFYCNEMFLRKCSHTIFFCVNQTKVGAVDKEFRIFIVPHPMCSPISDELANGSLLVSGSRDRMIKIWKTSDGRNPMTLKLPTNTGYRRDRYEDQNKNRAWLTICWPPNRPKQFISSTYGYVCKTFVPRTAIIRASFNT